MKARLLDRRRHRRHGGEAHGLQTARIRPGHDVSIVDVSVDGMQVESAHRLLPGTLVVVRVTSDRQSPAVIHGRIVRCVVWHLEGTAIRYRAGIAFDSHLACASTLDTCGYRLPDEERRPNGPVRALTTQTLR
jgi:PilZ domain